jgi:hypothetical protein
MNCLNPTLYCLLRDRFGEVRVTNEGDELIGEYKFDPHSGRLVLDIDSWGESYCISCPYCCETRQRLYINHRYGVWDEFTQSDNATMVRCFNEECFKKDPGLYRDLYHKIFDMVNPSERRSISYLRGRRPTVSGNELKPAPPPGDVLSLHELDPNHPSIMYLAGRGYDVQQLVNRYQLMYCTRADRNYTLAQGRIIIPIIQEEMWVGWQARYIGDIDWKAAGIPKYYTLPGMPKRLMLYNYDTAIKQSFLIITEGPTSCWSVYPYGVALFGKAATIQQQRLLIKKFGDKPILILLDGNAGGDAVKLYNQLRRHVKAGILIIKLPPDKDPGDYTGNQDELWTLIHTQAKGGSIILPGIEGDNNVENRKAVASGG